MAFGGEHVDRLQRCSIVSLCQAVAMGIAGGGSPRYLARGPDLLVDVGDMPLHRPQAQHKLLGDLLVALACGDKAQHLHLPPGQVIRVGVTCLFRPGLFESTGSTGA